MLWIYACLIIVLAGCAVGSGGTFNQAWKTEDKCKALGRWANQYHEKFPNSAPTTGKVAILYQDESFVPVFGTLFDQMSIEQLRQQKASVLKCFEFPGYSGALYANQHYRFLVGPLLGPQSGRPLDFTATREDIVPIVIRVRANKKWMEAAIAEAKAQPPTEEGYAKMLQSLSRSKEISADISPQEGVLFDIALSEEMRRIAPTILVPRIDTAIVNASNYEGVRHLKLAVDDNLRLFNLLPHAMRVREEERAKQALNEGVVRMLAEKGREFEARGVGIVAVKKGAAWYRDFDKHYVKVFSIGSFGNDLLVRFREQRRRDLEASEDAFLALLENAYSMEEIYGLMNEHLLEEELDDKVGRTKVPWIEKLLKKIRNKDFLMK